MFQLSPVEAGPRGVGATQAVQQAPGKEATPVCQQVLALHLVHLVQMEGVPALEEAEEPLPKVQPAAGIKSAVLAQV